MNQPDRFRFRLRSVIALAALAAVFFAAGVWLGWLRGVPWLDRVAALAAAVAVYGFLAFVLLRLLSIADGRAAARRARQAVRRARQQEADTPSDQPAAGQSPPRPGKVRFEVIRRKIIPFRW